MFHKYYDNGYSPIPIFANGKNPAIKSDWTKYCRVRPTEEQIEEWDSSKEKYNIGITCGPASGIIVVDIDTDDKDFMALCPPSPVRRRGMKGEARVFRYNDKIKSQSFPNLDILADGRQFLVPHSIHPVTKLPYRWLTDDTLENTTADELPELDISFLEKISPLTSSLKIGKEGRNNKLVDIISSMRGRGETERQIVKEIYDWDMMYHKPRLYTDASEGYAAKDERQAYNNAWRMMLSVTKTLVEKGLAIMDEPGKLIIVDENEAITSDHTNYDVSTYPEPTGLIRGIKDLIVDLSECEMPNLAIGGAVALMAVVCSNRFRFHQCWTNMFVLNLAPTGAGKSFPQTIVSKILNERLETSLIGYGNYQSSSAFSKNLVSRRERLDIIDEVSSLFAQMKDGGLWQQGIVDEMCKVWSASSGKFLSAEYAEREDTSTCYNPCVSLLGSSTIEGIKSNISKMMTTKGLLPRFLLFSHEDYGNEKEPFFNEALFERVSVHIQEILKRDKPHIKADILRGPIYTPVDLAPTDDDAIEFFTALRKEFFQRVKTEPSVPLKDMLTRGKEQTMKLATIHAAGNGRVINIQDLVWAKKTWEACFHNCTPLILETAVGSDHEKDIQSVLSLFKKSKGIVTMKFLSNRIQRLPSDKLKKLVDQLVLNETIAPAESSQNKSFRGWKLNKTC